ncbi:MAG: hypothetical protein LIO93_01925, partial [Bacteroidales bacterium]|nr:hypothetical protein [Bacteroidales bacterium]
NILIPVFYNNGKYYLIRTFRKHQVIDKRYNRYVVPPTVVEEFLNPLRATAEVTPQEKEMEEEKEVERDIPPTPLPEVPPESRSLPEGSDRNNDLKINNSLVEELYYYNLLTDSEYVPERAKFYPTVNIPFFVSEGSVQHRQRGSCRNRLKRYNLNGNYRKDSFHKMLHWKVSDAAPPAYRPP